MRAAFFAGLGAGIVIAGYLAYFKGQELSGRGKAIAQNLADGGSNLETYLVAQGTSLQRELQTLAKEEATLVAQTSAEQYMGDIYGLTPQRITRIGVIGAALGGS